MEDIVCERNEHQEELDTNRSTSVVDDNTTLTQFEEVLGLVEDETDRQATDKLNKEVNDQLKEFNEDETHDLDEDQLIEELKQQLNHVEDELEGLNEQVLLLIHFR